MPLFESSMKFHVLARMKFKNKIFPLSSMHSSLLQAYRVFPMRISQKVCLVLVIMICFLYRVLGEEVERTPLDQPMTEINNDEIVLYEYTCAPESWQAQLLLYEKVRNHPNTKSP